MVQLHSSSPISNGLGIKPTHGIVVELVLCDVLNSSEDCRDYDDNIFIKHGKAKPKIEDGGEEQKINQIFKGLGLVSIKQNL